MYLQFWFQTFYLLSQSSRVDYLHGKFSVGLLVNGLFDNAECSPGLSKDTVTSEVFQKYTVETKPDTIGDLNRKVSLTQGVFCTCVRRWGPLTVSFRTELQVPLFQGCLLRGAPLYNLLCKIDKHSSHSKLSEVCRLNTQQIIII